MNLVRYLRLYRVFARNNVVREMEFRANFWAKIATNIAWLFLSLVFLEVFFRNTRAVAGWSKGDAFLLLGTYLLTRALMDVLFTQNLTKIPEMVRMGTMDFVLTKPIPSQFYVSARFLSLDEFGSLVGAFAMLWYGASLAHFVPTVGQVAAWLFLVVCGVAIFYALELVLMTLSFWLVRIDNLAALTDTVIFIARFPTSIFSNKLRLLFTYIVPLAFIAYVPALMFKEGVRWQWLATGLLVTTLFVSAASLFWRFATRSYTSASS